MMADSVAAMSDFVGRRYAASDASAAVLDAIAARIGEVDAAIFAVPVAPVDVLMDAVAGFAEPASDMAAVDEVTIAASACLARPLMDVGTLTVVRMAELV